MDSKIKVFLVDDSPVARIMMKNILNADDSIEVVGEIGTGQGSIIMLDEVNPDVVMLEASVSGGMSLHDIIKEINNIDHNVKIIICADARDVGKIPPDVASAATNVVTKPYKKDNILRSIHKAVELDN